MVKRPTRSKKQPTAITVPKVFHAKTFLNENDEIQLGVDVSTHCHTVGLIAQHLLKIYPDKLANILFPNDTALIASLHDIGKITPSFQAKLISALGELTSYPGYTQQLIDKEKDWDGHAGASQIILQSLLENTRKDISIIAGQHHGFSPQMSSIQLSDIANSEWQNAQEELFSHLKSKFNTTLSAEKLSDAKTRLLAGLTSVADWIGSGHWFYDPNTDYRSVIEKAVQDAGFSRPHIKKDLAFGDIFYESDSNCFSPKPAQQALIDSCIAPGVYIFEAPMGLGKTEAALYAAYKMLATEQATGIYFALPTQLTSNKIYTRFNSFLNEILDESTENKEARLLHGQAWLALHHLGKEGQPGSSWFNSKKRGLLAPFAVGTLDQALMAAMNVKHGAVRAFGLAGKVVILDEVHSYDAYTNEILVALIKILRELHCTVIILSATLNKSQKEQLLGINATESSLNGTGYPLITRALGNTLEEYPIEEPTHHAVSVKLVSDNSTAIDEAIKRADNGQQVLWIENTVAEAQDIYHLIAARSAELNIECGLIHSRFTFTDRAHNEEKWVTLLGKKGREQRGSTGRIVIGTQVLEQSLDIDADFLVSRFAVTDMLLQRIGRLWRHKDTNRPVAATCEAWFIAPTLENALKNPTSPSAFGNTAYVYSPYILCRSLEAWQLWLQNHDKLLLPEHIRPLINATYDAPTTEQHNDNQQCWSQLKYELENGTKNRKGLIALRQLASTGIATGGSTLSDEDASTRYSELETKELLIVKSLITTNEHCTVTLLNDEKLNIPSKRGHISEKALREISVKLQENLVKVPISQFTQHSQIKMLKNYYLQHVFYLGGQAMTDSLINVAVINSETLELEPIADLEFNPKYRFKYSKYLGLERVTN